MGNFLNRHKCTNLKRVHRFLNHRQETCIKNYQSQYHVYALWPISMSNIFSSNDARESEIMQSSKHTVVTYSHSIIIVGCQKCNKRHNSKLNLEDKKRMKNLRTIQESIVNSENGQIALKAQEERKTLGNYDKSFIGFWFPSYPTETATTVIGISGMFCKAIGQVSATLKPRINIFNRFKTLGITEYREHITVSTINH
ncbi:Integrase catalytic domain-containing protein [Aphis craccivora]|uniref:Integrase catalytic domain-containing protein n=1 Tax=Aphis craccivora TaxID=307492 RepID=A0A6G0YDC5_APHCR|nr:Integrase catalytic domain-containing protein [Aphis craccivora]